MINRLFSALFLLACVVLLTVSADAQVLVSSHTNINNQRHIVTTCQTLMQGTTQNLYPSAAAQCTLNQNGVAIQTLPTCFSNPGGVCTATLGAVIEGTDYQTTARHGLVMALLAGFCTGGVDCYWDPLSYGSPTDPPPASRQFIDNGTILPGNVESFWIPNGLTPLIASSAETQFQSAQVIPVVLHVHANQNVNTTIFHLNGNQNANWTFTGSAGTTTPTAPSQGSTIRFNAPNTVPVQQVDTITGCKVDESHGVDCNSAQIIVEVIGVSIPPGSTTDIPPLANPTELLGGQSFRYKATVTQGAQTVNLPVTWAKTAETSGGNFVTVDPNTGIVTVQPQSAFQGANFDADIQATSPFDPDVARSGTFPIHIPTVTVNLTTTPTVGQTFEAKLNTGFNFVANVDGPTNSQNRTVSWSQNSNFNPFGNPGMINIDPTNPTQISRM